MKLQLEISTILLVVGVVQLTCMVRCQKTQMTRTALHVARSLDPESMEAMSVKTRTGDLTTIIVKRRNDRSYNFSTFGDNNNGTSELGSAVLNSTLSNNDSTTRITDTLLINASNDSEIVDVRNKTIDNADNKNDDDIIDNNVVQSRSDKTNGRSLVPDPVFISSDPIFVKGQQSNLSKKKAKSLLKVDADGIPVITGIRVPDDESDRQVWRNARVINGILVPYDKSDKESLLHVSTTGTGIQKIKPSIHKPSFGESQQISDVSSSTSDSDNNNGWTKVGTINKKKPTKITPIRRPVFANDETILTPVPLPWTRDTSSGSPVDSTVASKPATTDNRVVLQTVDDNVSNGKPFNYHQHPLGLWIPDEDKQSTNSDEKYVADRILDYIKNVNRDEIKRLSSSNHVRDARMINLLSSSTSLAPLTQSRLLTEGELYPNGPLLHPKFIESSTGLPSRLSFAEGVRTPVLQYAHPEYGIESVKSLPSPLLSSFDEHRHRNLLGIHHRPNPSASKRSVTPFTTATTNNADTNEGDMHADRSPLAFEPAAKDVKLDNTVNGPSNNHPYKRSQTELLYQRPKKTFSYFYEDGPKKYYVKYPYRGQTLNAGSSISGGVADYPLIYYNDDEDGGKPFWIRLGNSLKESVQNSIDKMTDLTKPVMEPIVEATNKISQNLGISTTNRDLSAGLRERFGTVSSSSLILPAIGIVAGGAALGLGAVAVGRYLNSDVVKMRNAKSLDGQPLTDEAVQAYLQSLWTDDNSRSPPSTYSTSTLAESEIISTTPKILNETTVSDESQMKRRKKRFAPSEKDENRISSQNTVEENKTTNPNTASLSSSYWFDVWHDTPCSKKVFCETMIAQTDHDAILLMEKKIISFLTKQPYQLAMLVSPHLEDVMSSVRRKDCSSYTCNLVPPATFSRHSQNSKKFGDQS